MNVNWPPRNRSHSAYTPTFFYNETITPEIIHNILDEPEPSFDHVVQSGIVPKFIELLQHDNHELQLEAAKAIANITYGKIEHTSCVIDCGALPILKELLQSSPYEDVQEQAVWAFANIACDCPRYRDLLLANGILLLLLEKLSKKCKIPMLRCLAWCLSSLCYGGNPPVDFSKVASALPVWANLLNNPDLVVLMDTCKAISFLRNAPNANIQKLIEIGIYSRLVTLLSHDYEYVVEEALRAIGSILKSKNVENQLTLNFATLSRLLSLLNSSKPKIKNETCRVISIITAGNSQQIQAVIDANIFPKVIEIISIEKTNSNKEVISAVLDVIHNGTKEQIRYLIQLNVIPLFCELLGMNNFQFIEIILNGLEHLLKISVEDSQLVDGKNTYVLMIKECGGSEKLESLKSHTDYIYKST